MATAEVTQAAECAVAGSCREDTRADINEVLNQRPPMKAREALEFLKIGGRKKLPVDIAGEKFEDPRAIRNNFLKAFNMAKQKLRGIANLDIEVMSFKQMPGDDAGESTATEVFISPKSLRQPKEVLAMLIAHEFAHQFGEIQNEGMVQSFIEAKFGNTNMPHKYGEKVMKFNQLAEIFDARWFRKGSYRRGSKKIYELYLAGNFDEIYSGFEGNFISRIRSEQKMTREEAKHHASEFFREVFPELGEGDNEEDDNVVDIGGEEQRFDRAA